VSAIAGFVNVSPPIEPILREEQRGLEAILRLKVFQSRYPFPSSKKYEKALDYIQQNLGEYPFIWYVLFLWNDLRLMGKVITTDRQYAEISRSWFEEWGISRIIQQTLEKLGFDETQANSGVTILRLLISQQNWSEKGNLTSSISLMSDWLMKDQIRSFININRYRGVLWFNKEAFETFLWWMMTTALVELVANPEKSLAEGVETLFNAHELINDILEAGTSSEYQVEKLLEALK